MAHAFRPRLAKPSKIPAMTPADGRVVQAVDRRRVPRQIDDDDFHTVQSGLCQEMPQTTFCARALFSEDDDSRQERCVGECLRFDVVPRPSR